MVGAIWEVVHRPGPKPPLQVCQGNAKAFKANRDMISPVSSGSAWSFFSVGYVMSKTCPLEGFLQPHQVALFIEKEDILSPSQTTKLFSTVGLMLMLTMLPSCHLNKANFTDIFTALLMSTGDGRNVESIMSHFHLISISLVEMQIGDQFSSSWMGWLGWILTAYTWQHIQFHETNRKSFVLQKSACFLRSVS